MPLFTLRIDFTAKAKMVATETIETDSRYDAINKVRMGEGCDWTTIALIDYGFPSINEVTVLEYGALPDTEGSYDLPVSSDVTVKIYELTRAREIYSLG